MREQHGPLREQHGFNDGGRQEQRRHYRTRGLRAQQGQSGQSRQPFGNYDLVHRIDVGGMGEVYLARQRTAFGREVAVKIIRSDLMHDVTVRKRFLREAEVSAHLKHEHILPLVEFGEEQGRLFLVTPYIEGGTLVRRLQDGPLSLPEVYQLFSALVRAVAYIHKRGVVHRDLKPSNILLDQEEGDGQVYVRLIDFGIASIQGMAANPPLTEAGTEMGTVAYMAPERLSGFAAPSNDIYSLGIILYQMLTGHLPAVTGQPVALPRPLAYVISRCTAPDPNNRFPNADELLSVFEQAYRSTMASNAASPISVVPASPAPVVPPTPQVKESQEDIPPPTPRRAIAPSATVSPMQEGKPELRVNAIPVSIISGSTPSVANSPNTPGTSGTPAIHPIHGATGMPDIPMQTPAPKATQEFSSEDYNAQTTHIDPKMLPPQLRPMSVASSAIVSGPDVGTGVAPGNRKAKRRSILSYLTVAIAILLLLIGLLSYLAFQTAISATVNISPQVHTVSKVLTVTAKLKQRGVDSTAQSVPADVFNSTKTGSQKGSTTGRKCTFIFNCRQVVAFSDVDTISSQLKQTLKTQIEQDLRKQAQSSNATTVGDISYNDGDPSADPPIGTASKTVTVTLTEQGSIEYIKTSDVQSLAKTLLNQEVKRQYGSNYVVLNQFTQIGQPVVQGVDGIGTVTMDIAAAGVAQYQIPDSQVQAIQNHIKGMKKQNVQAYLADQPGIDPSSVSIRVSYGDTLPGNLNQIRVVAVNPSTIPPVQLPSVNATATP